MWFVLKSLGANQNVPNNISRTCVPFNIQNLPAYYKLKYIPYSVIHLEDCEFLILFSDVPDTIITVIVCAIKTTRGIGT